MRTEKIPKHEARRYLAKAEEFERDMTRAVAALDWNAAGLAGVHAVISALDSLSTYYLGERCRSTDHLDAVRLARRLPLESAPRLADQASRVLDLKNAIEYEARGMEQAEIEVMAKQVRRIVAVARRVVGPL